MTNHRERHYRTQAVVLSRRDYGEADRIVVLFTAQQGRTSAIIKGARRQKSKLGPHCDYFARVNLMLGRGRDLDVITGVEPVASYQRLRQDLEAFAHASYYAELLRHFTKERQAQQGVYELLVASLSVLDEGVDPWPVTRHFELAMLTLLGYHPELFRCVNCRTDLQAEPNSFSARSGGMLCPRCRTADPSGETLSVNAQKYLRTMERSGLSSTIRLPISENERHELERVIGHYVRYVAEHEFQSLQILDSLMLKPMSAITAVTPQRS